jgi:hypothetical protein
VICSCFPAKIASETIEYQASIILSAYGICLVSLSSQFALNKCGSRTSHLALNEIAWLGVSKDEVSGDFRSPVAALWEGLGGESL